MAHQSRDAISAIKGYEYQWYFFIKMLIDKYNDSNYSFIYEDDEDIGIYKNNNLIELVQVKHHSSSKSSCEKTGLIKVYNSFKSNYKSDKYTSLEKIRYIVSYECKDSKLSPLSLTNCTNKDITFDTLKKLGWKTYTKSNVFDINDDSFEPFCKKLVVQQINSSSIISLTDEILNEIVSSNYFDTNLRGEIIEYKKHYLYSLLMYTIKSQIFTSEGSKPHITLSTVVKSINDKYLKHGYTSEDLVKSLKDLLEDECKHHINKFKDNESVKILKYTKTYNIYEIVSSIHWPYMYNLLTIENIPDAYIEHHKRALIKVRSNICKESLKLLSEMIIDSDESIENSDELYKIIRYLKTLTDNRKNKVKRINKIIYNYYIKKYNNNKALAIL